MYRYTALLAFCLASGPGFADELAEAHGNSVAIGDFYGVAYYVQTDDGYRVVTTVASDKEGSPVRFVATLQEGQKLLVSVPGDLSEFGHAIEFARIDGKLFVTKLETPPEVARAGQ